VKFVFSHSKLKKQPTDISQHVARLPIATENVDQKDKSLPGTELMHARRSNINER